MKAAQGLRRKCASLCLPIFFRFELAETKKHSCQVESKYLVLPFLTCYLYPPSSYEPPPLRSASYAAPLHLRHGLLQESLLNFGL